MEDKVIKVMNSLRENRGACGVSPDVVAKYSRISKAQAIEALESLWKQGLVGKYTMSNPNNEEEAQMTIWELNVQ